MSSNENEAPKSLMMRLGSKFTRKEPEPGPAETYLGFGRVEGGWGLFRVEVRDGAAVLTLLMEVRPYAEVMEEFFLRCERAGREAAVNNTGLVLEPKGAHATPVLTSVVVAAGFNHTAEGTWAADRIVVDRGVVLERTAGCYPEGKAAAMQAFKKEVRALRRVDVDVKESVFWQHATKGIPAEFTGKVVPKPVVVAPKCCGECKRPL